ncbi:MAG: adenylyltransferase/cytidyltransferase family protein [Patescibacteria group bacterium]
MNKKIVDIKKAEIICKEIRQKNKTVVISGGCFDILHVGHIRFLEKAKKTGDFLFILLESDKTTKKLKGRKRPINTQTDRAEILASLSCVDYVVSLRNMNSNKDYDEIVYKLKPDVIAITKNDPQEIHNKRQAKRINAKVAYVINRIENKSTSKLAEIISKNFDK